MAAVSLFRNANMASVTSCKRFYYACAFKPKMLVAYAVSQYCQTQLIRTLRGVIESVRINKVSILSGLNLEKM